MIIDYSIFSTDQKCKIPFLIINKIRIILRSVSGLIGLDWKVEIHTKCNIVSQTITYITEVFLRPTLLNNFVINSA